MKGILAVAWVALLLGVSDALAQDATAPSVETPAPDISRSLRRSEVRDLFKEGDILQLDKFDLAMDEWLDGEMWFQIQGAATSRVTIYIDKKNQRMTVLENGIVKFSDWKVSTGKGRWETRGGDFTPFEMNKNYFSKKFKVILPYGIKFDGGNLIHATKGTSYLGKKRSHGCVRLSPTHAKILFELVRRAGMKQTRVIVKNAPYQAAPVQITNLPHMDL
jgi:hypothetical protein